MRSSLHRSEAGASRGMNKRRWLRVAGLATLSLLIGLNGGCNPSGSGSTQPLKKMFELPHFALIERSGQTFDSSSMKGKVWVANFFFASCPGPCALLNEQMKAVHQATASTPEVQLLSISTDEADTPEILREYAKPRGADARWFFVTGKKDEIFDLSVKGFKLALVDADGVNAKDKFIHSTKIALVDRQGWIRGYYDGFGDNTSAEKERLLADVQRLLKEK